ncbi:hypothetical protein DFH08DRAFT_800106 [Mycena albidolilacea]|uniref:Uncharacterized protein n=1 Tax=Mycena albidolilacea TaxID=1033008 RepID=A0AAD7AJ41_9AGAR|nr:hypothetical protein DFH08DRAFT_800106 [Mycena albidolilacea]
MTVAAATDYCCYRKIAIASFVPLLQHGHTAAMEVPIGTLIASTPLGCLPEQWLVQIIDELSQAESPSISPSVLVLAKHTFVCMAKQKARASRSPFRMFHNLIAQLKDPLLWAETSLPDTLLPYGDHGNIHEDRLATSQPVKTLFDADNLSDRDKLLWTIVNLRGVVYNVYLAEWRLYAEAHDTLKHTFATYQETLSPTNDSELLTCVHNIAIQFNGPQKDPRRHSWLLRNFKIMTNAWY